MNRGGSGGGAVPGSPSAVAAEYRRLGARLLARLAEPGVHAERRGEQVAIVRAGSRMSVASGMPTGVLSELLQSGAVRCLAQNGAPRFVITPEGQARLRREAADGDGFGDQHRTIEERALGEAGSREIVRVNTREDPLGVFRGGRSGMSLAGPAELDAAERLRRDLALAQSLPKVTANWSRLVVDGMEFRAGLSASEATIEARRRVDAALRAVDPDFRGILIDVCGFSRGIEAIERENGFPARSGKLVLAFALRQLARHYGLSNAACGLKTVEIRHWGAEDYRPEIRAG